MMMRSFTATVTILLLHLGATLVAADECQDQFDTCFYVCEQIRKYGGDAANWWTCYPACADEKEECDATSTGTLDTDSCQAEREACYVPCYNMLEYCPAYCPYSACFNACAARECEDDVTPQENTDPPERDCQETFNTCFSVCGTQLRYCPTCDIAACYTSCADDKQLCDDEQGIEDEVLGASCNDTLIACTETCDEKSDADEERGQCHMACAADKTTCEGEDPVTPADTDGLSCDEVFDSCFGTCNTLLKYCYTCDIGACFINCAEAKNDCEYGDIPQAVAADTCQERLDTCTANCEACTDCDATTSDGCKSGCESEQGDCLEATGGGGGGGNTSSGFILRTMPFTFLAAALGVSLY